MARVAVVGGGIGGLAVSLFLARRDHQVIIVEGDSRGASADLESDFFEWARPHVPQARQPHTLLAPVHTVLRAEAPDVYADMLRLGAEEHHEFDRFPHHPPPRPGDEDLVTIRARRIVAQPPLHDAVCRQPEITVHHGEPATGLIIEPATDRPRVTGVRCDTGPIAADLVIDAAGRRSPIPGWLARHDPTRAPVIESHRAGIAYFCRWYRLRLGAPHHPRTTLHGSSTPFAIGGVFPSDNGVYAVHLVVSTGDPTRAALRDPIVFENLARTFPGCVDWLAVDHDPVGPVRVMAGLDNRRTSFVDRTGPIVTGLLGVGDSVLHTNPTLSLGIPFALRTAAWVAAHADRPADATLTLDHHRWITETLGPWFDHQVNADRTGALALRRGAEAPAPKPAPLDTETALRAALPWCALDDPHVMRARARVRHLAALPAEAYTTPDIQHRIAHWLAAHPNFTPPGPTRAEWELLTRQPAHQQVGTERRVSL